MISESEALKRVLAAVTPLQAETVNLFDALDRYAAQEVTATVPIPAFDQSAMDGYAMVAAESMTAQPLRVTGEQAAGLDGGLRLQSGCAIRIFTGAPIPTGADAVIMQEDVRRGICARARSCCARESRSHLDAWPCWPLKDSIKSPCMRCRVWRC